MLNLLWKNVETAAHKDFDIKMNRIEGIIINVGYILSITFLLHNYHNGYLTFNCYF